MAGDDYKWTYHQPGALGMIRDIPSYALPDGASYDLADFLCDRPTKIRKRGGWTSPASGNSTATVENLASFKSGGADGVGAIVGSLGKAGFNIRQFNTATGATTSLNSGGSAATWATRPFQHQNFIVCPFSALGSTANDVNSVYYCGGGTAAAFTPSAATLVAGDNRVTGIAATNVVAGHLGSVIFLKSATRMYAGRIVEVTGPSAVRVDPTPTFGFTANDGAVGVAAWSNVNIGSLGIDPFIVSGRYGVSFQNRVVLAYTSKTTGITSGDYVKGIEYGPYRLMWTNLPTETIPTVPGFTVDGNALLYPGAFVGTAASPTYNFLDVPSITSISGLAAVGDGQLVLFGPTTSFLVSGQLATETAQNNSLSFAVDQISQNVGCIAAKGIQYTPIGLIFPWIDNLYSFDGSGMKPLLSGHNARYLQDRLRAGDTIVGSFYAKSRSHYYLSMTGTDGGLLLDLENFAMSRITNMQLFDAVPDPSNSQTLWGARYWDTTSAAPTMTKGQLIQIDPLWVPTSANKNDADGTAVLPVWKSPAWSDAAINWRKMTANCQITYDLRGSGSPTAAVAGDVKLNVADATFSAALGTLPDTTAAADTGLAEFAAGMFLPEGRSFEIRVTLSAAADSFEILGVALRALSNPALV